jgi:hypothetical protein
MQFSQAEEAGRLWPPSGQVVQTFEAPTEKVFSGQSSTPSRGALGLVPAPAVLQKPALEAENSPAPAQATQAVAPKGAAVPARQSEQPAPSEYEPGSHEVQLDRPGPALNLPPSQSMQASTPPTEYLPMRQSEQLLSAEFAYLPGPQ